MASIKVKFRASAIKGREGTVYYQIIHERKVRQLLTGYKLLSSEWDESRSTVSLHGKRFRHDEDLMLDEISAPLMESYEASLRRRGLISNSISFYTQILRAVYNRAVEEDVVENRHPFRHVYTGIDKTIKRALPLASIRKIRNLELKDSPTLDYARDMFMMSFYLRGMSFIDMAFLKKSDLINNSSLKNGI